MPRIAVIMNPGAGSAGDKEKDELERALKSAGVEYQLLLSGKEHPAEEVAAGAIEQGAEIICACGGDGTVTRVVNAVMKSGRPDIDVAIIPLGTANLIAAALEIPSDMKEAIELLCKGARRKVDVGEIEGKFFVLGIGLGATERFVTQIDDRSKKFLGRISYAFNLLRQTDSPPFQLRITVNGKVEKHTAEAVTLANYWGTSKMKLLGGWAADDGKMEVVVNHRLSRSGLFMLALRCMLGTLPQDPQVDVFRGTKFRIETEPSVPVQLDGDESDLKTPIDVEVRRQALSFLVPPKTD